MSTPKARASSGLDALISIDLNADVGEIPGAAGRDLDRRLIAEVSSVNIACGGHAGDLDTMRATVGLALLRGAAIGAHPGYADAEAVGRRDLHATPSEIGELIRSQCAALIAEARALSGLVRHVKPHGALYHRAHRDPDVAQAIVRAVALLDPCLALVGMDGSALFEACRDRGLRFVPEAFADRAYAADGQLVPRDRAGSMLTGHAAVAQAVRVVREGIVRSVEGTYISITFETLCVHSDSPDAVDTAHAVRAALEAADVAIRPATDPR